jgi:hypothetical protein
MARRTFPTSMARTASVILPSPLLSASRSRTCNATDRESMQVVLADSPAHQAANPGERGHPRAATGRRLDAARLVLAKPAA